jgi:hypothetical protein
MAVTTQPGDTPSRARPQVMWQHRSDESSATQRCPLGPSSVAHLLFPAAVSTLGPQQQYPPWVSSSRRAAVTGHNASVLGILTTC